MTPDLEQALRELDVDWPATPDLAAAVSTRLEPRRKLKVPGTFRLRLAAVIAAVLVGGVLAVPDARTTVFRWFGIESVEIKRGEPSATPGASLDLGTPTTIERLPVPVLQARELGTPGVYVTAMPDGSRAASLVYDGPILVQTFRAQASPFIEKTIGTGADAERLQLDGATAFWIEGWARVRVSVQPDRVRLRAAADRREHAARRASRRAPAADRGRALARPRGRDRPLSSVTGPRASSPAARSDGPCGAGPPPTARPGPA